MKTMAKYHACNHCEIGEKAFKKTTCYTDDPFEKRACSQSPPHRTGETGARMRQGIQDGGGGQHYNPHI